MDAQLYDAHHRHEATHWWFKGRRRVIASVLRRELRASSARHILDVGCGTGGMFPLLQRFGEVEGAEFSPEARAYAARQFPQVRVHPCRLPAELPSGQWQLITAFDVIEHVDAAVESLETMRTRLVDDGQLVVTVPAFPFLWSRHDEVNHHKRRYTAGLLEQQLSQAGFRVTFSSYFNSVLFPAVAGVRLAQSIFPSLDREQSDLDEVREPLNTALTWLFGAEAPVGVSIIAVGQRR
jgi:SAM-dependent methyltransferase